MRFIHETVASLVPIPRRQGCFSGHQSTSPWLCPLAHCACSWKRRLAMCLNPEKWGHSPRLPAGGASTSTTAASPQGDIPKGGRSRRVTHLGGRGQGGCRGTGEKEKPPGKVYSSCSEPRRGLQELGMRGRETSDSGRGSYLSCVLPQPLLGPQLRKTSAEHV